MQLETLTKLAESHSMGNKRATELLAAAGVQPSAEVSFGKGTMRLYEAEPARAALVAAVKAEGDAAAAAALAALPPVTQAPTVLGIEYVMEAVAAAHAENRRLHTAAVGDHERIETATTKLADQNVLLLRAIESIKTTFLGKLDALQESFDARIDSLADPLSRITRSTAPLGLVPGRDPTPAPKTRVGIIGLFPAQSTTIEKEFADVFDLVLIPGAESTPGGLVSKLSSCHSVFVMQVGQSKAGERLLKEAGVRATRITGSISSLRNELTNLFVSISDKKAA